MNTLAVFACLLAATVAKPFEENVVALYMEHLSPYMKPCADEQKLSDEEYQNIQQVGPNVDVTKLACFRSCVMKQMGALQDNKIVIEPINAMIEQIHSGKDDEIAAVRKIAVDCSEEVASETDDCQIGMKYADCYIHKMFM